MSIRQRLTELGLDLPIAPVPQGEYVPLVVHDKIAYVSGQVSRDGQQVIVGPITSTTPQALISRAAHACILRALSVLEQELGTLDSVERILFLRGFIHAEPDFQEYSKVLDVASKILIDVFGTRGRHGRSAVGVAGLPSRGMIEIEVVAAITST